jgi:iron complex transport system permease protein
MRRLEWKHVVLLSLGLIFLAALAGLPFIGLEPITPARMWAEPGGAAGIIFWKLRMPRVLAGMMGGSALALAGLAFQAVFRNGLATPYTLGTASAASWGACLYISTGCSFSLIGLSGITWFAFAGAILSLVLVYGFSRQKAGGVATETMLLAGVAIGFVFSSLILMLEYLSGQAHSLRIMRWLMGGLDMVGYDQILQPLPLILLGSLIIFSQRYELNLLSLGEELAVGRGLNAARTKLTLLATGGLMVGAVVAVAGPIGFVGLIVPHVCRILLGPDHRFLVPASFLLGGIFLPLCDAVARVIIAPAELPVGIITALLGGPFFIWLLVSKRGVR